MDVLIEGKRYTGEEIVQELKLVDFRTVTRLNLSQNRLTIIPSELFRMQALEIVNISHNSLRHLNRDLVSWKNCRQLILSHNKLSAVPSCLRELPLLYVLDLGYNEIKRIPYNIIRLHVGYLILKGNPLIDLAKLLLENHCTRNPSMELSGLITKSLQEKALLELIMLLGEASYLKILGLNSNQLSQVPPDLFKPSLEKMSLEDNLLASIPAEIEELHQLSWLSLRSNRLTCIPFLPTSLTYLDLSFNQMSLLPLCLYQCVRLQTLHVSRMGLETLDVEIRKLKSLRTLNISGNKINSLPAEMGKLKHLISVDCSHNYLIMLPDFFAKFTSLQRLYLDGNFIDRLPPGVRSLRSLEHVSMDNNPMNFSASQQVSGKAKSAGAEHISKSTRRNDSPSLGNHRNPKVKLPRISASHKEYLFIYWMGRSRVLQSWNDGFKSKSIRLPFIPVTKGNKLHVIQNPLYKYRNFKEKIVIDGKTNTAKMLHKSQSVARNVAGSKDVNGVRYRRNRAPFEGSREGAEQSSKSNRHMKVPTLDIAGYHSEECMETSSEDLTARRKVSSISDRRKGKAKVDVVLFEPGKVDRYMDEKVWGEYMKKVDEWIIHEHPDDAGLYSNKAKPTFLDRVQPSKMLTFRKDEKMGTRPDRASVHQLVRLIFHPLGRDIDLERSFLFTFRMFVTPTKLLTMIRKVYERAGEIADHSVALSVQKRVIYFIKKWVWMHPLDFMSYNGSLYVELKGWAFREMEIVGLEEVHHEFLDFLSMSMKGSPKKYTFYAAPSAATAMKSHRQVSAPDTAYEVCVHLPFEAAASCSHPLMGFHPREVARQLTYLSNELFRGVAAYEWIGCRWVGEKRMKRAPGLSKVIDFFNHTSGMLASFLLQISEAKDRVCCINRYLVIAQELLYLQNFSSFMAIISALESVSVSRLKCTWSMVSSKAMGVYDRMREIMDVKNNLKYYRRLLDECKPPINPYIAVFLKDLTFIEEGNQGKDEKMILFSKCDMVYTIINKLYLLQESTYDIAPIDEICSYLKSYTVLDEDEQWQLSTSIEARLHKAG